MSIIDFAKILLRGVGQVMFQGSELTGLLFLAGIFFNSYVMGLGAVLGALAGTVAAVLLRYKKEDIEKGLYGFNGTLVGIALLFFFQANPVLIVLIILVAALSTFVMNFMMKLKVPPYTFPFVATTWAAIILANAFYLAPPQASAPPQAVAVDFVSSLTMGIGQVMFQGNIVTGVLFLAGILVSSRIAGAYALLGSLLGALIALAFSFPLGLVNIGIFGFNGVLCGIAFSGKTTKAVVYAIASIALSVLIMYGAISFSLVALTAPFVFATWIVSAVRKK